jgi:hypothetical protein
VFARAVARKAPNVHLLADVLLQCIVGLRSSSPIRQLCYLYCRVRLLDFIFNIFLDKISLDFGGATFDFSLRRTTWQGAVIVLRQGNGRIWLGRFAARCIHWSCLTLGETIVGGFGEREHCIESACSALGGLSLIEASISIDVSKHLAATESRVG